MKTRYAGSGWHAAGMAADHVPANKLVPTNMSAIRAFFRWSLVNLQVWPADAAITGKSSIQKDGRSTFFRPPLKLKKKNFALPTGPELFPQKKAGTWRLLTATQIRDEQANEQMKNAVQSFLWDWDFEMDDERVMD